MPAQGMEAEATEGGEVGVKPFDPRGEVEIEVEEGEQSTMKPMHVPSTVDTRSFGLVG